MGVTPYTPAGMGISRMTTANVIKRPKQTITFDFFSTIQFIYDVSQN